MKKMQSLNNELFKTLEAEEMNIVSGGKHAPQDGTRVKTLEGVTVGGGSSGSKDSEAGDDGADW